MSRGTIILLLMLLALTGWNGAGLGSDSEVDRPSTASEDEAIDLRLHVENETLLVRFDTVHGLDQVRWDFPGVGKDYTAGWMLLGGGHHLAWGYEDGANIQVQDFHHTISGSPGNGGWGASIPGPFQAGVHYMVFHSEGLPVEFHIVAENATYEVLNEPVEFHHIDASHPDWERQIHIQAGFTGYFSALMKLDLYLETIQIHAFNGGIGGGSTTIDLGYEECASESLLGGASTQRAFSDEPVIVSFESKHAISTSPIRLFVVESSIDLGRRGCYDGDGL